MHVITGCLPAYLTRKALQEGVSSCVRHVWGLTHTEKVMEFAVGCGCFQCPGYPGRFVLAFPSLTSVTRGLQKPWPSRKSSLIHKDSSSLKGILFSSWVLNFFLFCDLPSFKFIINRCPSNSECVGEPSMARPAGSCDVDFMEIVHWGTVPKIFLWDIKCMALILKSAASPMFMQLFIFQNALKISVIRSFLRKLLILSLVFLAFKLQLLLPFL